jgi:hypothetical protein
VRDKLTGELRKLHNEELNVLYFHQILCDQIEKIEMCGTCRKYGAERCIEGFPRET